MAETDWIKRRGDSFRTPAFTSGGSWKDRPIDVRTEAARQVGRERQGQIRARRTDAWRRWSYGLGKRPGSYEEFVEAGLGKGRDVTRRKAGRNSRSEPA